MPAIEQRFLRVPNLWSSTSCLHTVLDLGEQADALTTDVPGFTEAVLDLLPGLHRIAVPMGRGCFIAEVMGEVMLEVQRLAGIPAHRRFVSMMRGRDGEVRLVVASNCPLIGAWAFDIARAIVHALSAGKRIDMADYLAARAEPWPVKPAPGRPWYPHPAVTSPGQSAVLSRAP
jgi:cyanophycin synthetase